MLPTLCVPEYTLVLPTSKKSVHFRPFLVREEKLLLMAQASGDPLEILGSIKSIVRNCVSEMNGVDMNLIPSVDLEFMFLKIRAVSISNIVDLSYKDTEDQKVYDFKINLDEVKCIEYPDHSPVVQISEDTKLEMDYPSFSITESLKNAENEIDIYFSLIRECIKSITSGADTFNPKDYPKEEVDTFISQLPSGSLEKIQKFFETQPKIHHRLTYKNSLGNEKNIDLETLTDFFSLW